MNDFNLDDIKKKAKKGVIVLTSRTALIQVIAFFSTFLLTVLLTPEIFGVFFATTGVEKYLLPAYPIYVIFCSAFIVAMALKLVNKIKKHAKWKLIL